MQVLSSFESRDVALIHVEHLGELCLCESDGTPDLAEGGSLLVESVGDEETERVVCLGSARVVEERFAGCADSIGRGGEVSVGVLDGGVGDGVHRVLLTMARWLAWLRSQSGTRTVSMRVTAAGYQWFCCVVLSPSEHHDDGDRLVGGVIMEPDVGDADDRWAGGEWCVLGGWRSTKREGRKP